MDNTMRPLMLQLCVVCMASMTLADVDVAVNFSFSELNDYGEWVVVGGYGKVWRPYADQSWRPFYYGRWVWTSDGWMWESDEPFGWIVCHYGNWYYDDDWGWVWVPGYEWSPARVEWYVTDYEIGWMPLFPPPHPGHVHVRSHVHWLVCPVSMFASVDVRRHVIVRPRPGPDVRVTVYAGPPKFEVVRRYSRSPIVTVNPQRVTVRSGAHTYVRVQSSSPRGNVVVPVGQKYRTVNVRSGAGMQKSSTVTVTKESSVQTVQPGRSGSTTVRVESSSGGSRKKARAGTYGETDVRDGSEQGGKKVTVKVRKKEE